MTSVGDRYVDPIPGHHDSVLDGITLDNVLATELRLLSVSSVSVGIDDLAANMVAAFCFGTSV